MVPCSWAACVPHRHKTPFPGRRVSVPNTVSGHSWAPILVLVVQEQPILGPHPALGRGELGSAALLGGALLSRTGHWATLVSDTLRLRIPSVWHNQPLGTVAPGQGSPRSSQLSAAMVGRVLGVDEPQTQRVLKGSLRAVVWAQLFRGHHRSLGRAGSWASLVDQDILRHGQQPGTTLGPLGTVNLRTKQTPDTVH